MNERTELGITTKNLREARAAGQAVLGTMARAWGLVFTPEEERVNLRMGAFVGERIHRRGLPWTLRSVKAGFREFAKIERRRARAGV